MWSNPGEDAFVGYDPSSISPPVKHIIFITPETRDSITSRFGGDLDDLPQLDIPLEEYAVGSAPFEFGTRLWNQNYLTHGPHDELDFSEDGKTAMLRGYVEPEGGDEENEHLYTGLDGYIMHGGNAIVEIIK